MMEAMSTPAGWELALLEFVNPQMKRAIADQLDVFPAVTSPLLACSLA
jgi:hypothetical protein